LAIRDTYSASCGLVTYPLRMMVLPRPGSTVTLAVGTVSPDQLAEQRQVRLHVHVEVSAGSPLVTHFGAG
jgi:hypothetical protein